MKIKIILIFLVLSILIIEAKSFTPYKLVLNEMDKNISKDSVSIHKLWQFNSAKSLSSGMIGFGDEFKVLDFRDTTNLYMGEKESSSFGPMQYKIEGNFIFFYKDGEMLYRNSDNDGGTLFRISKLSNDSLIITISIIKAGDKAENAKERIELHYKVKNH